MWHHTGPVFLPTGHHLLHDDDGETLYELRRALLAHLQSRSELTSLTSHIIINAVKMEDNLFQRLFQNCYQIYIM